MAAWKIFVSVLPYSENSKGGAIHNFLFAFHEDVPQGSITKGQTDSLKHTLEYVWSGREEVQSKR